MELATSAGLPIFRFPETVEEASRAEDVLSKELAKLSLSEHEKIIFDLHGIPTTVVGDVDEDDPKFQSKLLQALQKGLDNKITSKKADCSAYKEAKFLNPVYVADSRLCWQFLRAKQYCVDDATEAITAHYEAKKRLFGGGEILAREVQQSDLSADDIKCLRQGHVQLLPTRDTSGRIVTVTNITPKMKNIDTRSLERSMWYFSMATLRDDDDISKHGTVGVIYNLNHGSGIDISAFESISKLEQCWPQRQLGNHICYNQESLRPLVAGYRLFRHEQNDRFRLRAHFGKSLDEIHFHLNTFGIQTDESPMGKDHVWSTKFHLEWLERLRKEEEQLKQKGAGGTLKGSNDVITVPRSLDVLFGKTKRARFAAGTRRALHLVDQHYDRYVSTDSKFDKKCLSNHIVSTIRSSGGRFLRSHQGGCWVQVDDETARNKIAHWFRHMKSKQSPAMEQYTGR